LVIEVSIFQIYPTATHPFQSYFLRRKSNPTMESTSWFCIPYATASVTQIHMQLMDNVSRTNQILCCRLGFI